MLKEALHTYVIITLFMYVVAIITLFVTKHRERKRLDKKR